jgi:thiamine pyrophosphokinase
MNSAVVVIGGDPPHPACVERLPTDAFVVAADSGLDHALALGLRVDLLVGDMDSVSAAALDVARCRGIPTERHPAEKDATDVELAIDAAVQRGCGHVVVVSGNGDRLDHSFGALLGLARPDLTATGVDIEAWWGPAHVLVLRGPTTSSLSGAPGVLVSLLPVHGTAVGVSTAGLRYPLHDEDLPGGTSRGISNEFVAAPATVSLRAGHLLVVVPHALPSPRGDHR